MENCKQSIASDRSCATEFNDDNTAETMSNADRLNNNVFTWVSRRDHEKGLVILASQK
jgi:hypothetical protein